MGYMALMRNLRNFEEKGVDMDAILERIADKEQVLKSKQFPYRFYSAYKNVSRGYTKTALSKALQHSTHNMPSLRGKTAIFCDVSGSMSSLISEKSQVSLKEVGNLFGAISHSFCVEAIAGVFGEKLGIAELDRTNNILTNMGHLNDIDVGHSTNAYLILQYLLDKRIKVDRIILFSDMQCYDTTGYNESLAKYFKLYKKTINPKVVLYSIDLAGHGTLQFAEDDGSVIKIAGFSDSIFKFIEHYERGAKTLLDFVENYNKPKQVGSELAKKIMAAEPELKKLRKVKKNVKSKSVKSRNRKDAKRPA